jgi:hypothetical protein
MTSTTDPNSAKKPSTESNAPEREAQIHDLAALSETDLYTVALVWRPFHPQMPSYLASSGTDGGSAFVTATYNDFCNWRFTKPGAGPFAIMNPFSKTYLGYVTDNHPCQVNKDPGDDKRFQWTLEMRPNGLIIRSVADPGQILEVSGKDEQTVETWYDSDQTNQRWVLSKVS